jgi:hypothetical protein
MLLDMSFKLPVNKQHVTKCVNYSLGAFLLQGLIGKVIANECFHKPAQISHYAKGCHRGKVGQHGILFSYCCMLNSPSYRAWYGLIFMSENSYYNANSK